MNEQSVSIIIPIYKVPEKYLRKCIESAVNQTYKNIEIILVDDGSPDNCGIICDEYAKKDNRIQVVHQENKGLSAARNTGFKIAKGNWVTFLDGDDWIENNMCEEILKKIDDNQIKLCMFGVYRDSGNNSKKMEYSYVDGKIYKDSECKILQEDILNFTSNISCAYAKFFLKSYLQENNILHNEALKQGAEGIEFNLRAFEKIDLVLFVKEYYYHYIYNDNSISANSSEENNYMVLKCFEEIKRFISKSENAERLKENLYNRLSYVVITTAISGYFNPKNKEKFANRKEKFNKFLNEEIVKETFKYANVDKLDKTRKITFKLIKKKYFYVINIIARIRMSIKNCKRRR